MYQLFKFTYLDKMLKYFDIFLTRISKKNSRIRQIYSYV